MVETKQTYFALLENADSSIMSVPLEHDYKFILKKSDDGWYFLSQLEGAKIRLIDQAELPNIIDADMIFITKDYPSSTSYTTIQKEELTYLLPTIDLLRAFKEGGVNIKRTYCFSQSKQSSSMKMRSGWAYGNNCFHIEPSEIPALQKFFGTVPLTGNHNKPYDLPEFILLAMECLDISYLFLKPKTAFLELFIGLEALLNPGSEARYRISRNCATLTGKTTEERRQIFSEIKELYELRSKIVHGGKVEPTIPNETLSRLRKHLINSIKTAIELKLDKQQLINVLNEKGF